jgi:hypothetical protein
MEKGEDTWRKRYWELAHLPLVEWPSEAKDYAIGDSVATLEVFQAQEEGLAEEGKPQVLADQYRQCRADFALRLMSAWGLRTDREGTEILRRYCEDGLATVTETLLAEGLLSWVKKKGERVLKRNTRLAQARMLDVMGEDARLTDTGKAKGLREVRYISVDEEACTDSGDDVLLAYTKYTQYNNLLSGHVKAMEEGWTTPIHPRFEVLLESGRTSASNPNTQNVRRQEGARECYIPRKGWCYLSADYDRAELHTLAQVCLILFGRSVLADALNSGIDPHTKLGAELARCTYEELDRAISEGDEEAAEWRQRAKAGSFGYPGGMGPRGMMAYAKTSYGVVLTFPEACHLYEGWQRAWPVVSGDYLDWIRELTRGVGWATIEHLISGRWRGRVGYCQAANTFFQGMSADAMKRALWAVTKACYMPGSALYGCRPVNEVHDEFLLEAPLAQAPEAAIELQRIMVDEYNHYTKDVPVRVTPVLMDRWSKKAKPIVGPDGRLQVWRYKG